MIRPTDATTPRPHRLSHDALLCGLAIDPRCLSRNRGLSFYADPKARTVHVRAHALRRLFAQLAARFRHNEPLTVELRDDGVVLSFDEPAVCLRRRVHLSLPELRILRYLLLRDGVDVPGFWRLVDEDAACILGQLSRLREAIGASELRSWASTLHAGGLESHVHFLQNRSA